MVMKVFILPATIFKVSSITLPSLAKARADTGTATIDFLGSSSEDNNDDQVPHRQHNWQRRPFHALFSETHVLIALQL